MRHCNRDNKMKRVISWSLYDWANSAFATSVMAGFFPVFFKQYLSSGNDVTVSTFQLGTANSLASLIIALLAPFLGAIADKGNAKKKFLIFFAFMGIVMTGSLCLVAKGEWILAMAIYVLATIGFSGGNIFYDALIVDVAAEKKVDFVSALGFSLGYLGGGILFLFNVLMVLSPTTFGLDTAIEAMRISFFSVAIWWAIFSIPIVVLVKEQGSKKEFRSQNIVSAGFRQLLGTLKEIRKIQVIVLFLFGYFLYIDGVHTIIRMAVDYGMSLGFHFQSLIVALLITQFVGFPCSIVFGMIGEKLGSKTGIFIGIGVYLIVIIWGFFMDREMEFFILAIAVGMVQGGVQSLSRSFYAKIIPKNNSAEFFGFYNMLGRFSAVLGPVLMGWVGLLSGNPRYAILSVSLLFVSGAVILAFVNEGKGREAATTFS